MSRCDALGCVLWRRVPGLCLCVPPSAQPNAHVPIRTAPGRQRTLLPPGRRGLARKGRPSYTPGTITCTIFKRGRVRERCRGLCATGGPQRGGGLTTRPKTARRTTLTKLFPRDIPQQDQCVVQLILNRAYVEAPCLPRPPRNAVALGSWLCQGTSTRSSTYTFAELTLIGVYLPAPDLIPRPCANPRPPQTPPRMVWASVTTASFVGRGGGPERGLRRFPSLMIARGEGKATRLGKSRAVGVSKMSARAARVHAPSSGTPASTQSGSVQMMSRVRYDDPMTAQMMSPARRAPFGMLSPSGPPGPRVHRGAHGDVQFMSHPRDRRDWIPEAVVMGMRRCVARLLCDLRGSALRLFMLRPPTPCRPRYCVPACRPRMHM